MGIKGNWWKQTPWHWLILGDVIIVEIMVISQGISQIPKVMPMIIKFKTSLNLLRRDMKNDHSL